MERKTEARTVIQGVVVSDKNAKTIVVLVETHKRHSKYGKRVKYGKKYYAHDEENAAKVGDTVTIMATRKLSATKRWRLVSIDKKAELSVKEAEAELKKLVDEQILTNSQTLYEEGQREREQAIQDYNATAKYTYTAGGEEHKTNNPALAARYDAQHRFFGMSKTKQAMAKMTGQWKKFDKLWNKSTDDLSLEEQEEVAKELNSMFRK